MYSIQHIIFVLYTVHCTCTLYVEIEVFLITFQSEYGFDKNQ